MLAICCSVRIRTSPDGRLSKTEKNTHLTSLAINNVVVNQCAFITFNVWTNCPYQNSIFLLVGRLTTETDRHGPSSLFASSFE